MTQLFAQRIIYGTGELKNKKLGKNNALSIAMLKEFLYNTAKDK